MQKKSFLNKKSRKSHAFTAQKPRRRTHKEKILFLLVSSSHYETRRRIRADEISYTDAVVETLTRKKLFAAAGTFCIALTITTSILGSPLSSQYSIAHDRPAVANEKVVEVVEEPAQNYSVSANVSSVVITRDGYSVTAPPPPPPPVIKQKLSFEGMKKADTFVNDPTADVQYPFGYGAPMSDGFGPRTPICFDGACTKAFHSGTDFLPGAGTEIQAIANGVVKEVSNTGTGTYGSYVILSHEIDGEDIETVYAHLMSGSSPLKEGAEISVGDLIGKVGSTGASTGAHLHFEVHIDGTPVDPMKWDKWGYHTPSTTP